MKTSQTRGLAVVFIACTLVVGCTFFFGPSYREATKVDAGKDAAKVARGKYLAEHVAGCEHCHSRHDWATFSTPALPGTEYGGGECFDEEFGMPGKVCASNLTPHQETGLGSWTDGEIIRAIREGVDKDGNALFMMMPYGEYASMSDADVEAIVAFLRTVPPIENAVPAADIDFPVSGIMNYFPEPLEASVTGPDRSDTVAYGGYLSTIGGCKGCHTPGGPSDPDDDRPFAGGAEFQIDGKAHAISGNLTPHETGIGKLPRENFIGRFKAFNLSEADTKALLTVPWQRQSLMGWKAYSGMSESDLGAIYDFLMTQPAVDNKIATTLPAATGLARAPLPDLVVLDAAGAAQPSDIPESDTEPEAVEAPLADPSTENAGN